jgi:hypothetical protein
MTDMQNENATLTPDSGGSPAVPGSAGECTMYAVAVALSIKKECRYWWSDDSLLKSIGLYFIPAPNEEVAKAIGVDRALREGREETPDGTVAVSSLCARRLPNNKALAREALPAAPCSHSERKPNE